MGRKYEKIQNGTAHFSTSKGEPFVVDEQDADAVSRYTWCVSAKGYLVANIRGKVTKLHRYILNPERNEIIDHRNGNKMDNRRCNLRICTNTENVRNCRTSKNNVIGIKGVKVTPAGKYNSSITVDGKKVHIGNYDTVQEAINAREAAEMNLFGEYAPSANIPEERRGVK